MFIGDFTLFVHLYTIMVVISQHIRLFPFGLDVKKERRCSFSTIPQGGCSQTWTWDAYGSLVSAYFIEKIQ